MGLKNLNPSKPITAADLPPENAMDAEYIAADVAHSTATDPHPQYGGIKKIVFTGTTAATQGTNSGITHGLSLSKILALNGLVTHSAGVVCPAHILSAGYEFTLSANGTGIFVGNVGGNSANILSKPFTVVVDYLIN